ncbi:SPOR domain-containing protein [Undibacterium cyanobacteriorum]|uniref:SPOR domain-containing protein n=1 Tax=Undibacterium cyanobacteriorum TaxID=3073561 RepID=A0ABY9RCP6_9BURK|nr:SPOR domain-containing protein [Undibacterium sp. 20NA77.5]WMW79025.1 SPOR domain-containing protein [Undibacterium sp. 20NA77.5]
MSLDTLFKQKKQEATEAVDDGEFRSRAEQSIGEEVDAVKPNKLNRLNKRANNPRRRNEEEVQLPEKKRARRRLIGAIALVLAAVIGLPMIFESEPKSSAPTIAIEIPSKDANNTLQVKEVARPVATPVSAAASSVNTASINPVAPQSIDKNEEVISPAATNPQTNTKNDSKPLVETSIAKVDTASKPVSSIAVNTAANAKPENLPKPAEASKKSEVKVDQKAEVKQDLKQDHKQETKKDNKDEAARALALLEGRDAGDKDNKQNKTAAADKASAKPAGSFSVQVAAMSSQAKIKELQAKLKAADIQTYTQKIVTDNGEVIRIRVGPFNSKAEAEKMQKKLVKLGLNGSLIPH